MNSLRMSFWIVPRELFRRHALFLGGDDVERQHRQHRAVHGHRHRHLIERDAGEQRAHVVDRIDRDARHADVAGDARMIAVVAAVGGEIEGDRKALLPGREVAPVEGVGILRRGEAGILPDGPRLGDVHGRVGAAQIGRRCRDRCRGNRGPRGRRAVDRLHRDAFRREPGGGRSASATADAARRRPGKSGNAAHIAHLSDVRPRAVHPDIMSCASARGDLPTRHRRACQVASDVLQLTGRSLIRAHQRMRLPQRRQRVAPTKMKSCTPGGLDGRFRVAPAGPPDRCSLPAAASALGRVRRLARIDLVGRAQAGEPARRSALKAAIICVAAREAVIAHRLDPAGLEEILGEVARAVNSAGVAEIGEEDLRPRAGRASMRSEASRSASNGSASRKLRQRLDAVAAAGAAARTGATSSTATGASARSGKSLVPVSVSLRRATAASRSARTAATFSGSGLARARPRRRPPARSPETAPRPRGRAVRSDPRSAGAGGGIGDLGEVGLRRAA